MDSSHSAISPADGGPLPQQLDENGKPIGEDLEVEEETWLETRYYDVLELWDRFRDFAWDPINRTVLGRDKKSWGEIGIFYLIFYGCLASFWAVSFILFLETVPEINEGPKYVNLIEKPGVIASQRSVGIAGGVIDAALANSNRQLLATSSYTNQTEINFLNSGPAQACNITAGSRPDAVCVYLAVNRVHGFVPTQPLSFTCSIKDQAFGSGIFQVVHSHFPAVLFQPGGIHHFVPRREFYRNPVVIVVFPKSTLPKEGTITVSCSGKRSLLAVEATFSLDIAP